MGALAVGSTLAHAESPSQRMSFFITHVGLGNGGNLGGIEGADAHCNKLAAAAGSASKDWRAYLSTQPEPGKPAIDARDRIGTGPWRNARGVIVANTIDELHGANSKLSKQLSLDERGNEVNGREDKPPKHDVITGSTLDGRAFPAGDDRTCNNYRSQDAGSVRVGHHDRQGPWFQRDGTSWNSAHVVTGCGQADLQSRGGQGLFYCFARGGT